MGVSAQDVAVLRRLATSIAEAAGHPEQEARRRRWFATNALCPERPLVYCSPEGAWEEILPEAEMRCAAPLLRSWERGLRMRLYAWEHFQDDQVLDDSFRVHHVCEDTGWGLGAERVFSDVARGAWKEYGELRAESDLQKLRQPRTEVDWGETHRQLDLAHSIFDGLLRVELHSSHWWSTSLIGEYSRLRGLEQIMVDMCERPQWVHEVMRFLLEGRLRWLDDLESQGLLALNNGNDYVGSGGFGFTSELPAAGFDGSHVRVRDMWGFAEAQEITGVSPTMHEEFVLRYQMPLLERFGLNCYGCCEPLHHKVDILRRIPRLRRISMSPFVNIEQGAAAIGQDFIYSAKPNPALLASNSWRPDLARRDLAELLEKTRGLHLEIILQDIHTTRGEPKRLWDWAQMAMEMVAR